ncbi:MAG: immune inhibitor A [Minicystis sp.]
MVGPAKAYVGTQCIATQIGGNYHDNQPWAMTTATSPAIDLTGMQSPLLTFRMWVYTEGSTYDGANLQVSTDGGMTYSVISNPMPAYTLMVDGMPAWGGNQSALGWQLVQADFTPYGNQVIRLRFAFRSDSSGTFPGVYIDDILVN